MKSAHLVVIHRSIRHVFPVLHHSITPSIKSSGRVWRNVVPSKLPHAKKLHNWNILPFNSLNLQLASPMRLGWTRNHKPISTASRDETKGLSEANRMQYYAARLTLYSAKELKSPQLPLKLRPYGGVEMYLLLLVLLRDSLPLLKNLTPHFPLPPWTLDMPVNWSNSCERKWF